MTRKADWSFVRRPRWIVGHLLALVLLVAFVVAARWQWQRHQEVSDRNDDIAARSELAPVGFDALPPAGAELGDVEFRVAVGRGVYDPAGQVTIRSRSFGGAAGCHVVTPLVTGDGAVLVNRGWVELARCAEPELVPAPPSGQVELSGLVRATQRKGRFGAADPADGVLTALNRLDVERIAAQSPHPLAASYLELRTQVPPVESPPVLIPPPTLDDGPHLAYTGQWLLFALVAVVGYPLVLRRQARAVPVAQPEG